MAFRDGGIPQLDFPDLTADLIRQLRIRGPVGLLNFSDVVIPTFLVGSRGVTFTAEPPIYAPAEMVEGSALNPAASTQLFTTGALAAGVYDIFAALSYNASVAGGQDMAIIHQNAAGGSLRKVLLLSFSGTTQSSSILLPVIGYQVALNDKFICRTPTAAGMSGSCSGSMGFKRRVDP